MSVSQRKSRGNAWLVKYKDASGKWCQKQFRTREEAEEFDANAKLDAQRNEPLTLAEAVMTYLTAQQLSASSLRDYEYVISGRDLKKGGHTAGPAEHLADRYVETLTRADLESVRQNIMAGGAGARTVNLYVAKLKAALRWCESEDLITVNPWSKYRNLPVRDAKHHDGSLEDLQTVYAVLPAWMQWAVDTAMALCLRPGVSELFALEWSAFDWNKKTATVYMPKVRASKTVAVMEIYMENARERYTRDAANGKTIVCRNSRDKQVTRACYQKVWERSCAKAGVHLPFYAIRHIAASAMLASGADIAAVASMLGHKNIATTEQFYIHTLADSQQRAIRGLPVLSPNLVAVGGSSGKES